MVVAIEKPKRRQTVTYEPLRNYSPKLPSASDHRHPISRWYLMPAARATASALAHSPLTRHTIRPTHITLVGLLFAATAAGLMLYSSSTGVLAAVFVLAAWFCDRTDGLLARRSHRATQFGAWLDANIDELIDLALQTAVAAAAVAQTGSQIPWLLLIAFIAGKYLFVFGLNHEATTATPVDRHATTAEGRSDPNERHSITIATQLPINSANASRYSLIRRLYHLPGNADVRIHLLILALLSGWLTAELAILAAYYNLRWLIRYPLMARRLGGFQ